MHSHHAQRVTHIFGRANDVDESLAGKRKHTHAQTVLSTASDREARAVCNGVWSAHHTLLPDTLGGGGRKCIMDFGMNFANTCARLLDA